ncbi:MAG: hypothetical protein F4039_07105 [Gammaproteobacteria bacterium]|nr:hypothetical protein [Gammaproteobacteria bacterium]MXX94111.1 hypothetical protein [Gammaproteobacteria bacterium]MYF53232.1 hypothetical protein [Gammaproteobacteria bacterium]MYK43837.1 hypothetical protein [Gammaproteobacteria bacterium]
MKLRQLLLGLCSTVLIGALLNAQGQSTTMPLPTFSPDELKQMLETTRPTMKQKSEQDIKAVDKNQDGELNIEECREMINSAAKEMADGMEQFTTISMSDVLPDIYQKAIDAAEDTENKIKADEFDKALEAFIDNYDADENDMLSADELTEWRFDFALAMMGLEDESDDETEGAEDANSEE